MEIIIMKKLLMDIERFLPQYKCFLLKRQRERRHRGVKIQRERRREGDSRHSDSQDSY